MMMLLFTTAFAWDATPEQQAVLRAVSARDGAPTCELLDAMTPDPVQTYLDIVEHVSMPPWAPMQAARCIAERHLDEAEPQVREWLVHPDKKGLATLVVTRLDRLPSAEALPLAKHALSGPHAALAKRAFARSTQPEIKALATP